VVSFVNAEITARQEETSIKTRVLTNGEVFTNPAAMGVGNYLG
jgi:hypothetical protein